MAPHQLIEGMVIAGRAVAHHGYIYIRGEYRYVLDIMDGAIVELPTNVAISARIFSARDSILDLATHTGAGAYASAEKSRR